MENLTIAAHWKGTWCERLLKCMYYVTLRCDLVSVLAVDGCVKAV